MISNDLAQRPFETLTAVPFGGGLWTIYWHMGIAMPSRCRATADALIGKRYERVGRGFEALVTHLTSKDTFVRKFQKARAHQIFSAATESLDLAVMSQLEIFGSGCGFFGLGCLARLEDDYDTSLKNLLQSFQITPRLARKVFAPEIYRILFQEQCEDGVEAFHESSGNVKTLEIRALHETKENRVDEFCVERAKLLLSHSADGFSGEACSSS